MSDPRDHGLLASTTDSTLLNHPMTAPAAMGAILCAACWGGNSVAVKVAAGSFAPCEMAAWRFTVGCLATSAWALSTGRSLRVRSGQRRAVLVNALMLFAQISLFNLGTTWSTSIHSVILINTFPFFAAVCAHVFLPSFRLTTPQVVGLFIAFGGLLLMFADQLALPDRTQLAGDLILLGSAACLAVKVTYVKTLLDRLDPLKIVFWEALLAVPIFWTASLLLERSPGALQHWALVGVLYQGAVVSGFAFLLWTTLLTRHAPGDLSSFSFAAPLFGMVFGTVLLRESVTVYLLAGGLLVAAGIHRVNKRPPMNATHQEGSEQCL